jgi:hypothetical protein
MTPEHKAKIHNEITGMFKGLGRTGGSLKQWFNGNRHDKRRNEPAPERREGNRSASV